MTSSNLTLIQKIKAVDVFFENFNDESISVFQEISSKIFPETHLVLDVFKKKMQELKVKLFMSKNKELYDHFYKDVFEELGILLREITTDINKVETELENIKKKNIEKAKNTNGTSGPSTPGLFMAASGSMATSNGSWSGVEAGLETIVLLSFVCLALIVVFVPIFGSLYVIGKSFLILYSNIRKAIAKNSNNKDLLSTKGWEHTIQSNRYNIDDINYFLWTILLYTEKRVQWDLCIQPFFLQGKKRDTFMDITYEVQDKLDLLRKKRSMPEIKKFFDNLLKRVTPQTLKTGGNSRTRNKRRNKRKNKSKR